jgi:hypothetical protein
MELSYWGLYMYIFSVGAAVLTLIFLYRALEVISFMAGMSLGKKKAYNDELMKMKAQLDFARANGLGGTPVNKPESDYTTTETRP